MGRIHPLIGQRAPALSLPSIPNGETYTLPVGEKPIALFFFPAAGTTGCTKEACAFRDAKASNATFKRHPDLEIVGVSGDAVPKQMSFSDQYGLTYPLVSDADGKYAKDYQVDRAFLGLTPGRATFFVDRTGIVKGVCEKNIDFSAHAKFVEKMLLEMETRSTDTKPK